MSRTVLVTGGNRGIGFAIARSFAEAGDKVAFTFRTGEPPTALTELGCLPVRCDITDPDDVDRAVGEVEEVWGAVEVLVANAGANRDRLLMRMSEEDFASVLDTNLTGTFRTVKRVSRGMLKARKGRIILISSAVALRGEAGQANYAASKAGLIGFARSLARELGSRSITCNVIAPGLTDTDMAGTLGEEQQSELLRSVPLGRLGQPEEIAAAARFLAGDGAAYITGAVLPVDGGAAMGH